MLDLADPLLLGTTMRIHRPARNVLAFYDGRMAGKRAYSEAPNWLDDGAYELGVATYAVVDGDEALVYDTHISCQHAGIIRSTLRDLGVKRFIVVLSHWHRDHIAGNAVFADCEILAQPLTAEILIRERAAIEEGTPPIMPLIGPNRMVADEEVLRIGGTEVVVHHVDIHSRDGTVLMLPDANLLLAGDTLEDPVTYVAEPDRLETQCREFDRLAALGAERILPNHGSEARILSGGYGPDLIDATRRYIARLLLCAGDPHLASLSLKEFVAEDLARGAIEYFAPYERVHAQNVMKAIAAKQAV